MGDYTPVKGDRVRVMLEGEVAAYNGTYVNVHNPEGRWIGEFKPAEQGTSVEKVEPPVTVFKPGDVVRSKSSGLIYSLGDGGYIAHRSGRWMSYSRTATQPSSWHSGDYEKVSLG